MAKSDELIALAELPWWEAKQDIEALHDWCLSRPLTYTATLNWFPHVIYDLRWHVGSEAAAQVIRLGLLLELYARQQGHPPRFIGGAHTPG